MAKIHRIQFFMYTWFDDSLGNFTNFFIETNGPFYLVNLMMRMPRAAGHDLQRYIALNCMERFSTDIP